MNKWHKKQVFAPGSTLRFMAPPHLGTEGWKSPVTKRKRPGRKPPGTPTVDEISVWKGSSALPHLLYPSLF